MKKIILIVAGCVIGGWMAWALVASRNEGKARVRVDVAAHAHDPVAMELEPVADDRSQMLLSDGVLVGIIRLKDGNPVKFWFLSRHVQPGKGITRFDFADGQIAYLNGAYCCEVDIGGESTLDKSSLLKFIAASDGTDP